MPKLAQNRWLPAKRLPVRLPRFRRLPNARLPVELPRKPGLNGCYSVCYSGNEATLLCISFYGLVKHPVNGEVRLDSRYTRRNGGSMARGAVTKEEFLPKMTDAERQIYIRDTLNYAANELTKAASQWGFETVKHLVIINGAGIAGATAMLSSPTRSGRAELALPWFFFGMVLALAAIFSIYIVGLRTSYSFRKKVVKISIGESPTSAILPSRWFRFAIYFNWLLSTVSAIAFIVGAYKIIWPL